MQSGLDCSADVAHRALVGFDPVLVDQPQHDLVLAVAEAVDRLGARRVVLLALGELDAARVQERPDALVARLAVDVSVVVLDGVERHVLGVAGRRRDRAGRSRTSPSTRPRGPSPSSSGPRRGRRGRPGCRRGARAPLHSRGRRRASLSRMTRWRPRPFPVAWSTSCPRICAPRWSRTRRRSAPGTTSRRSPATSSSAGSRTPSAMPRANAGSGGPAKSSRKACAGPCCWPGCAHRERNGRA